MSVTVNMPQMAANGLSENWLFKYCGNLHWQELCRGLSIRSADLRDDSGARLYPTFVAIFARYDAPLASVRENDRLETATELSYFGRSFFHSLVTLRHQDVAFKLEMLTTFVTREQEGRNDLRKSTPSSDLSYAVAALTEAPEILNTSQGMRRGEIANYGFDGFEIDMSASSLDLARDYEPSPYSDFNGANLLYFASYPTICDTLERHMIMADSPSDGATDWAMATSTVARDVFYYGNLDLGASLRARLKTHIRRPDKAVTHSALLRASDDLPIADIFTSRRLVA